MYDDCPPPPRALFPSPEKFPPTCASVVLWPHYAEFRSAQCPLLCSPCAQTHTPTALRPHALLTYIGIALPHQHANRAGNPGAVGLYFHGAQGGATQDVTVRSDGGYVDENLGENLSPILFYLSRAYNAEAADFTWPTLKRMTMSNNYGCEICFLPST